jgi:hypothetical protein
VNLNNNPTAAQLADLIAAADPHKSYVLWVDHGGQVHLSDVATYGNPASFCIAHQGRMRFRCATFFPCYVPGTHDLGPEAASDMRWVVMLFRTLYHQWEEANGRPLVERHPMTMQPVIASRAAQVSL